MTQDEIIEMARFAGIRIDSFGFQGGFIEEIEAFAKLVAAKATAVEREACAKVCDEFCYGSTKVLVERAIRARGEQA
tara:strand:+ start:65 stop:295 length:231 start_codon:yes stop_codon:yes gene_type:complete